MMSGTRRTRKNDVIANDQLPSRNPGIPVTMPTASATSPEAANCSTMSVYPAIDMSPAVYAPAAYIAAWPSASSPA